MQMASRARDDRSTRAHHIAGLGAGGLRSSRRAGACARGSNCRRAEWVDGEFVGGIISRGSAGIWATRTVNRSAARSMWMQYRRALPVAGQAEARSVTGSEEPLGRVGNRAAGVFGRLGRSRCVRATAGSPCCWMMRPTPRRCERGSQIRRVPRLPGRRSPGARPGARDRARVRRGGPRRNGEWVVGDVSRLDPV